MNQYIIELDKLTSAERKMLDKGSFLALHKFIPVVGCQTKKTKIVYDQCTFSRIDDNKIAVEDYCANGKSITFDLKEKTVMLAFARLNYEMLCIVAERCKELGWENSYYGEIMPTIDVTVENNNMQGFHLGSAGSGGKIEPENKTENMDNLIDK